MFEKRNEIEERTDQDIEDQAILQSYTNIEAALCAEEFEGVTHMAKAHNP